MNHVISIPVDRKLAEFIGKRGSENSITFYDRKFGEHVIVGLVPTSISDKFHALPESMLVAQQIVISTSSVGKDFGEAAVAASLLKKRVILTDDSDVGELVYELGLEHEVVERERLLDAITLHVATNRPGGARVDIDKAFHVKGIGTVLLGIVTRGEIKVHDELYHPSGKVVGIRSLQSQDIDIDRAGTGTRVGIAAKGIEYADVSKGDILTINKSGAARKMIATVHGSKFSNDGIIGRFGLALNFSYCECTVEPGKDGNFIITTEKGICMEKGDRFILVREKSPRAFASGEVVEMVA